MLVRPIAAVEAAISQWNAQVGRGLDARVDAVRWESHSRPEMGGTPQKILNRQIVDDALNAGIESYALPDYVREDYLSSYDGDRFVESMRYVRSYPTELPILRDLLPEIQTPVQIIAGMRDPAVPPVNAEYLHERLPDSKLDLIVDAGHFVWEDAADEYATLVTSWWRGGYANTAGR